MKQKRMGFNWELEVLLALLIAGMVVSCGSAGDDDASDLKIVGGVAVATSDPILASTVALVAPDGMSFCTGTLITKMHVVTAAHCLIEYDEPSLYLAFGQKATRGNFSKERLRTATSFMVHPEFSFTSVSVENPTSPVGDIALIKLSQEIPAGFKPAKAVTLNDPIAIGESLILAGYGRTSAWWWGRSGELRKVTTKLSSLSPAAKELAYGPANGKSSCNGDSGGPAFVDREGSLALVGVTSRGDAFCYSDGIYTDIRYYEEWLKHGIDALP